MIGKNLGHYEVLAELGRGGMGEVYRARDTKLGREVAIKVLPAEFAQDAERLARLEREAQMLAALNHPNIGAIYGLEESNDTRFLVLELVEGDTLQDRLKGGPIRPDEALSLALQIAEALEAAHEKGIIHRDLKPANVKLTTGGKVKVLDFGLAKAFSANERDVNLSNSPTLSMQATQQGVILGTAGYMSPEQASGGLPDRRTDIWSFGVVLFEMLTGRQVFSGSTVSHILAAVLATAPDWDRLPPNLNPKIRELLERCLEKEAKDRYHDVADVRIDLQKILADPSALVLQPVADGAGTGPRSQQTLVAAAIVSVLIGGAAVWFLKPAPPTALRPVVRSVISPVEVPPINRAGHDIAISRDGSQVAYLAQVDGQPQIYLRKLDELEGAPIRGAENPLDLFFSPDGDEVGFSSAAGLPGLLKISTQGGPTVALGPISALPQGASWGIGNEIIATSFGQLPHRVPSAGGTAEDLAAANTGLSDPEILPGGNAVLFTSAGSGGGNQVAALNLQTDELTVLVPAGAAPRYAASGHLLYRVADTLWAAPFDAASLQLLGDAVPVLEGVQAGEANFAISDNGSLAYITQVGPVSDSGGTVQAPPDVNLNVFDREGNRRPLGAPPRPYRNPRVSPDGTQVAVEIIEVVQNRVQSSIWVYDLGAGAAIRRLTQVTEGNNWRPLWTPDGQRVTFASDRDGPVSIYWQPADGSGPAEPVTTPEEGTFQIPYSWSPDGVLVFGIRRAPGGTALGLPTTEEIWTRNADGDMSLFYDLAERNQFGAAFSPDGRWIAYTSAETLPFTAGDFRIFVSAYPGNSPRYEIATGGTSWPVWSADGGELFFRASGVGNNAIPVLNSVRIETEPTFRFTTEESVFVEGFNVYVDYRDYDPLADGSGFVMLTPADAPEVSAAASDDGAEPLPNPEVVLVQNFFEVLKRLAPIP